MGHDKILVIGATGYIGKFVAKAGPRLGYPTFALIRSSTLKDPAKAEILTSLKEAGVQFLEGSFEEYQSLVDAVKQVDVVISTVGFGQLKDQQKLILAIKEAGHIKRFLPSEFGNDVRKVHTLPQTEALFGLKLDIQNAVIESGIPYTIVSSNSFAAYFLTSLGQSDVNAPPRDKAVIYGHAKSYIVDEDDIGTYTVKAALDPRAENKTIYFRPAHNLYSHAEVVELWEKKSGSKLQKTQLEDEDILKKIDEIPFPNNILLAIFYSIFVKGDQSSFDVPDDAVEATELYPDVKYTTVDKFLDQFL